MKAPSRVVLIALAAMTLSTASAVANPFRGADSPGMGGWRGASMPFGPALRAVGLTDEQRTQVTQIMASHRPQLRTLGSQLRSAHQQLMDKLYGPGAVSAEELAPLRQQIAQIRDQFGQESLQMALEIRAILTPDQLAKAAQIRQRASELRTELRNLYKGDH